MIMIDSWGTVHFVFSFAYRSISVNNVKIVSTYFVYQAVNTVKFCLNLLYF